jgi:hypothetical protein
MPGRKTSLQPPPTHPAVLNLLIVAQGETELYRTLLHRFRNDTAITILRDRRQGQRRQAAQAVPVDQRRGERRSASRPTDDLRQRKYIFARPHARCPHD